MRLLKRMSIVLIALALLVSAFCVSASAAEYRPYGPCVECREPTLTHYTSRRLEETERVSCFHQDDKDLNPEIYDTSAEYKIITTYYCESCGYEEKDEQEVEILIDCPLGALD